MKKSLLLSLCGLATLSALAYTGTGVYADASFQFVSPNGQYLVGDYYGNLTIYDRSKDAPLYLEMDDNTEYVTGLGNRVSDTGVILCATALTPEKPTYYYNGEWYELTAPESGWSGAFLHGITPDATRIVGCVDASGLGDDYPMFQTPAYWDLQDNGEYGEYQILPFPKSDLLGKTPQYVTATYVSDNGKVVAGQIIDKTGLICQPIVYIQADDGSWSYNLPLEQYFDTSDMPDPDDDYEAYNEFLESLPLFGMNDIRMSPNGKYITTNMMYYVSRFLIIYTPTIINLQTGEFETVVAENEETGLIATQVFDDGSILAFNTLFSAIPTGYYYKDGQLISIYDYICNADTKAKAWAEENLKHEKLEFDPDLDEDVPVSLACTGLPVASADMSVIALTANSEYWTESRTQYGYVIDLSELGGVEAVAVSESAISFDANGALILSDDVTGVQIYDLSGRLVATDSDTASALSSGLYIVNAVYADGSVATAKVCK